MKKNRHGQAEIISQKNYLKILKAYKSEKFRLLFQIAIFTGERWGAIVQLKVDDIFLKGEVREYITFQAKSRKASPSGERETRQVRLHENLKQILKSYKVPSSLWLFPNKLNPQNHITFRAADLYLRKALSECGLEDTGFSTHSTRRTYITNLYRQGASIVELKKITGHRSDSALLKYIEVDPNRVNCLVENYQVL